MSAPNPCRDDDSRMLEILHLLETEGTGVVRARFGLSNSAVQGIRTRFLRAQPEPCQCRRKENRDGGMPARWWAT